MEPYKTPSPKMAAAIVLVLLTLFGFSYVAPMLSVPWLKSGVTFDAGLQNTLQMLLVWGVGYYMGTSKSSDDKNQIIATQAKAAAKDAAPLDAGGP